MTTLTYYLTSFSSAVSVTFRFLHILPLLVSLLVPVLISSSMELLLPTYVSTRDYFPFSCLLNHSTFTCINDTIQPDSSFLFIIAVCRTVCALDSCIILFQSLNTRGVSVSAMTVKLPNRDSEI